MKILCISFKEQPEVNRKILAYDIFKRTKETKIDLVIFPGNFLKIPKSIKDEEWISDFAEKNNIHVFYEKFVTENGKNNYYELYSKFGSKNTCRQLFVDSSEVETNSELCESLIQKIDNGDRTINVGGVNFGIIICGENNVLKNLQLEDNRVIWRCMSPNNWNAEVILNPSHNTMGNWGKLQKRFEFLSNKYGYVIYLTNSSCQGFGKSSLKIYNKGREIKNSDNPDFVTDDKNAIACILEII